MTKKEWVAIATAAMLEGVMRTTIERRIQKGYYVTRQVPSKKHEGKFITEIAVSSLSVEAQAKWLESKSPKVHETTTNFDTSPCDPPQQSISSIDYMDWYQSLSPEHSQVILYRQGVVQETKETLDNCADKTQAIEHLAIKHNSTVSTLYRWLQQFEAQGLYGLRCKKFGSSRSKLTDSQTDIIICLIHRNPAIRATAVWNYLTHVYKENPVSGITVSRYMKQWKKSEHEIYQYLQDPDKWRGNYMLSFGNASKKAKHFCHYWEMDSSPADVMCLDGRWSLIGEIDIFSRKVKIVVSPTSKSLGIAECMRAGILDWGIPEIMVRDEGKDYTSLHIDAVCESLKIKTHTNGPYKPWEKPHIERFFRTLSTSLFENLKDFIGHNVAERKAIENRRSFAQRFMKQGAVIELRITAQELQSIIDDWIENVYHQNVHGGIGTTPELKAAESSVPVRGIDDERALDVLLLPAGERKITKKGIRYEGGWYQSEGFVSFVGDMAQVRRDHDNAGKLYVFDLEGTYITTAWDSELDGIPVIDYQAARKDQAREMHLRKRLLGDMADEILPKEPIREYIEARKGQRKIKSMPRRTPANLNNLEEAKIVAEQPDFTQGTRYIDSNDYKIDEPKVSALKSSAAEQRNNLVPLFSTMTERYEFLCEQDRPFTDGEIKFFKEFYKEEAGKRMLRMDGNILEQKLKEGMQRPSQVAPLPIKQANGF